MTHQTINKILFILFIIVSPLQSQTVEDFVINSSGEITENLLKEWAGFDKGAKYFPGILDTAINNIVFNLSEEGYFHPEVIAKSVDFNGDSLYVNLNLNIDAGNPTYIENFFLENLSSNDSLIFYNYFEYHIGSVLIKSNLQLSITELLEHYENDAFPFANIKINSISFYQNEDKSENLADLFFSIDKGPPSKIDSIEIVGNDKTNDNVIIRQLRLEAGEVYSQKRLEEIPKLLNRLSFFNSVEEPQFYFDSNDNGILKINVKEKQTNNFDGIIGYVPPGSGEDNGYLTGFINVSLRNLFGTGRAAAFKWEKLDRYSELLEVKYLEPWIIGMPFNIQLGLVQRKQDTSYVQRNLSGSIDYLATENISASLLFESESTIPTESDENFSEIYKSDTYTTGVDVSFDSRDNIYAPSSGLLFGAKFKYSSKSIKNPVEEIPSYIKKDSKLSRFEVDFNLFLEFINRHVIALAGHMRDLNGDFVEVSDLYRLGGTNSLRGYREDQFRGNRTIWSNIEYRLSMSKLTYAFLFFDMGYYLVEENTQNNLNRTSDFLTGYGLGLSIETGLGLLGVSYALGKGDSFREGKIHFGLLNEF